MKKTTMHYIRLDGWPIFKQLQLEEALMRSDKRNWCLINQGSEASVVLGISGKPDLLINSEHHQKNPVPLIRRFSGGGTVYVDSNTLFVTFICNSEEYGIRCFPKEVMEWTEKIYAPVFSGKDFRLRENDYVFGERKFGGNAQYLQKNRWLHHSTLLWEYDAEQMNILKLPPKMPGYRNSRTHSDFLCTLKDHFEDSEQVIAEILKSLSQQSDIQNISVSEVEPLLDQSHRKTTTFLKEYQPQPNME
jgi:lipoate-protein ligase A